ncbi:hypothetical protein V502_00816, partial [Pseudogymnoascus sp. VKM F-4520 (FW-2644)]
MGEYMLEEEAILVDLSIEEVEKVPGRNNIIWQWGRAIAFVVGIIEVLLHLLVIDLFHHGHGDLMLFLNTIQLPMIVKQVAMGSLLAAKVNSSLIWWLPAGPNSTMAQTACPVAIYASAICWLSPPSMPVIESGNKLTEIMAHNLKEQRSAGYHPVIPAVDHTSIFCCKVPPR